MRPDDAVGISLTIRISYRLQLNLEKLYFTTFLHIFHHFSSRITIFLRHFGHLSLISLKFSFHYFYYIYITLSSLAYHALILITFLLFLSFSYYFFRFILTISSLLFFNFFITGLFKNMTFVK